MNNRQIQIRAFMDKVIADNQFNVANLYPFDLKCDEQCIEKIGESSATIAWVAGDSHTHMAVLGVHQSINEMLRCYTRLSNQDKFFKLVLTGKEDFKFTELSRDSFESMETTKVQYSALVNSHSKDFTLCKNENPIIAISFESKGDISNRVHHANLKPLAVLSDLDRYAGEVWANQALCKSLQTLFFQSEYHWIEEVQQSAKVRALVT